MSGPNARPIYLLAFDHRLLPGDVSVQVDGGVHLGNIAAVREAGANLLVSGSGVFWGDDPGAAYRAQMEAATAVEV